jgi:glucose/arabinose dehydrogenase
MKLLTSIATVLTLSILVSSCNQSGKAESTESSLDTSSAASTAVDTTPKASAEMFKLEKIADGLVAPIGMAHAGDGSNRYFILEQPGRIRIIKGGKLLQEPFLNIESKLAEMGKSYSEMGLLGLAFHPDYKNNGRFFIYYSAPADQKDLHHKSILAEYKVSSNPDKAATQERVIMEFPQPESNHNGGHLVFGPDGYLYIGIGDGGGAGDKHGKIGNAQDTDNLLGTIIRIDINSGNPYGIPTDNPFLDDKSKRDEIWAYGLRNPWRFSFDRKTGQLFCGDVGQNKYEEVDIIEKSKNYGWRAMEGYHVFDEELLKQLDSTTLAKPIDEYEHVIGNSITGGFVYRGQKYPELQGKYIFGDWSGKIFYLEQNGNKWHRKDCRFEDGKVADIGMNVNGFGEDEAGEIYVIAQDETGPASKTGAVYRLTLAKKQ